MGVAARDTVADDQGSVTQHLLVLTWWFVTIIWSIFTPPHRTFAARVLLFQPLWGLRVWFGDSTWMQDLVLCLSLHAVYGWLTGALPLKPSDFAWINLDSRELWIYIEVFSLLGLCGGFSGGIVHRGHQLKPTKQSSYFNKQSIDEQLLPPLLISARTTHSRLFPKKHSFSYSYLYVGIPVGVRGTISRALSVDSQRPSWFDVQSSEYLVRSTAPGGLAEKLKQYLHTQGVTDQEYSFAYLVTAPRFLGYSFNPVSFWYLYDADAVLKFMILEVNNTFDERRMYLLRPDRGDHETESKDSRQMIFSETFEKDFHVSPFNSRKGSYSLRATDPLTAYEQTGQYSFDNTIVLRSSKDSAKIVARVFSEGSPKDATAVTRWKLYGFIASWWWVGFLTFPRIIWEARKLFFQKKLHVWYRPEVIETSVGRKYTADEVLLEEYFRAFLEDAVGHCESPLRLIYEPAHAHEVVMYSPGYTYEEDHKWTLTFRVLSPAFYTRFVHYAHAQEAFDRECMSTDDKNRTLSIQPPSLLPTLLQGVSKAANSQNNQNQNFVERFRWSALRRLRCPPLSASYSSGTGYSVSDIRTFGDAELDVFVKRNVAGSSHYRRIAVKLFLASRLALGIPGLISAADFAVRGAAVVATMVYCSRPGAVDVLRPRAVESRDVWVTGVLVLLTNSIHLWSLIKG